MNSDEHEYEYLKKTGAVPSDDKLKDQVNGSHKIDPSKNSDPSQRPRQKSHRHDENFDHQVKHSTIKDESDQDENDWNSSLSSHLFSIGRERNEREKSRCRRESKNRDRVREDKSRKKKVGDKIRERNGDRCSDGGKRNRDSVYVRDTEKEREQERSNRDRNRSERYRAECDRERSQDKGRSYDVEYKEIEPMSEVRENVPESRRIKEEKEEVRESEADDERDKRTVFAYQISLKADEKDVYEFFSRAGKVRDVRLIMDRNSRRSKGVGYIEFYDVMSVPVSIALSGQSLLGQPVMVKPSEAEKNLVQSTTVAAGTTGLIGCYSWEGRQLHVSNLHVNIKEDQLHEVFEPFGKIELVQLPLDRETRQRKGYGFVQFARHEDARAALSLDGQLEIAGHVMKVSATADHTNGQEVVASAGDFDDDRSDGMGVAGSVGAAPAISPPFVPIGQIPIPVPTGFPTLTFSIPDALPLSHTIGNPSECLLLKNMFDPKLEPEPDFDQDIKDDVKDKCTKFGELKHVYVDKNSAGFVYLRFQQSESALAAQRALHGRWFAGKMITATFLVPENYNTKFPESK